MHIHHKGLTMKTVLIALIVLPFTSVMAMDHTADQREVVDMPPQAKTMFLKNMRGHMESLDLIIEALGENDLTEAAVLAEMTMGSGHNKKRQCEGEEEGKKQHQQSSHQGKEKGFGKFMPKEMKMMGMQLHIAANDFADVAREGNMGEAYKSLRNISAACVACHQSYQVK